MQPLWWSFDSSAQIHTFGSVISIFRDFEVFYTPCSAAPYTQSAAVYGFRDWLAKPQASLLGLSQRRAAPSRLPSDCDIRSPYSVARTRSRARSLMYQVSLKRSRAFAIEHCFERERVSTGGERSDILGSRQQKCSKKTCDHTTLKSVFTLLKLKRKFEPNRGRRGGGESRTLKSFNLSKH